MQSTLFFPNTGGLTLSGQLQTYLALSKARLFKMGTIVSPTTVLADLIAGECDYDGYAAQTLTTWLAPYLDPNGGVTIQPGTKLFSFVHGAGITNMVGGFWVEDAGHNVIVIGTFGNPVPMVMNGDAIPLNVLLNQFGGVSVQAA